MFAIAAALLIGLFGFWFLRRMASGIELSRDPRQHALAALMVNAAWEPRSPRPESISAVRNASGEWHLPGGFGRNFLDCWRDVTDFINLNFTDMDVGKVKLRLEHALALAKPSLNEIDYRLVRDFVMAYPN
jgi:hypothetical protein